ncbi:flagellar hook-associated protein FlgL [Halopseudomonas pelagia]|uniref:Flagellar hook-associated protein 3 n=1 Tax=Halopseudomonas pelagia TaxID=553151 RepID=A0AA91U3N9_9GAMM|nr:flagellar hook-associated protein FlgL [Halopseudomonas pelagia]PCC99790.1 flagellar hook-associated protein 3 [Halopseudomonas pelagia]QFY56349.1 flagellar hook-associated protein FlgL [Halopseudomonas pelagia]
MRISTIQAFNIGVQGVQDNYSKVTRTQEQVSSGKRILSPADDPVASVRLLQLGQQANKLDQYDANLKAATNSLTQEEATINSINNVLQRVREIALQAGNGALDQDAREALGQELVEREEELLGLFNSQNARGEYLFGGFQSQTQPFVKGPDGGYTYVGDEGQRSIDIAGSKQVAINDNGKKLFEDVLNVNRVVTQEYSVAPNNPNKVRISLGVVEDKAKYDSSATTIPPDPANLPESKEGIFYQSDSVSIEIGEDGEYTIFDGPSVVPLDPENPPVGRTPLASGTIVANDDQSYQIRFGGVVVTLDGELTEGDQFQITRGAADGGELVQEKRSILQTVAELRNALETTDDSREGKLDRRDQLAIAVQNLDNGMNQVLSVQTSIGARLNVIESTQDENSEVKLINQGMTAELAELDYAEALSRLSFETVVLQAAQQSFVKVSGLSLFNLL